MLKLLREHNRLNETLFLGVFTIACFGFSIFRMVYTDSKTFLFLNWNLFLAFIPWAFTSLAILKPKIQKNKITIFILLTFWLLFFPNAPYILTDLFHLRLKVGMPLWFDLVLILSFAWTGLLFGFLSLWDLQNIIEKSITKTWATIISIGLIFLGSFGIYIGRYLRWNSWDIITQPFNLMYDIGDRIINPFEHPRTWGMTIFMGIFLNMIYWSFRLIRKRDL
ncbi:MAG: DUF1361 domain-containing protein [Bacteroidetes bacterium]|nr:DUF1361 domain-containing protein [Bacteroidota bacterium]